MTVELDFMMEGAKHLDYFMVPNADELPLPWYVCFVGPFGELDAFEPELFQLTGPLLERARIPRRVYIDPNRSIYSLCFWLTAKQAALIKLIYG